MFNISLTSIALRASEIAKLAQRLPLIVATKKARPLSLEYTHRSTTNKSEAAKS